MKNMERPHSLIRMDGYTIVQSYKEKNRYRITGGEKKKEGKRLLPQRPLLKLQLNMKRQGD